MKKLKIVLVFILIIRAASGVEAGPRHELRGEFSSWLGWRDKVEDKYIIGTRYLPEMTLSQPISIENSIDMLASAKLYFEAPLDELAINSDTSDAEFYRLWARWSEKQFEVRAGLQKINFGPAKILRSLMWFDRIDPRDPFGLTDGVKGVLIRRYFLDNSNVWFWGLYGNNDVKGLEAVATEEGFPEFGGRYQFPLKSGEMAFSYHHRVAEKSLWPSNGNFKLERAMEDRLAVDGFLDLGVGAWCEAVAMRDKVDSNLSLWSEFLTMGMDYTFEAGVHVLGEHFIVAAGPDWDEVSSSKSISAFSADYALNMLDRIKVIITYDWFAYERQSFMGWQRTYDDWRFDLLGFSDKEESLNKYSGDGIQFIVTFNH